MKTNSKLQEWRAKGIPSAVALFSPAAPSSWLSSQERTLSKNKCINVIITDTNTDRKRKYLKKASKFAMTSSYLKVTVDLRGVFWGKQYSALCINGKYTNLYIIGELI